MQDAIPLIYINKLFLTKRRDMVEATKPIVDSNNFIILDKYTKQPVKQQCYQTEKELENEFIHDLVDQGYEFVYGINNSQAMLSNLQKQLERLNNVKFTEDEWSRFVEEYLLNKSNEKDDRSSKIHANHIYDFKFTNGELKNIYLIDKKYLANNSVQVIHQVNQEGTAKNRYDVTILVNGLPLVQVELKKTWYSN